MQQSEGHPCTPTPPLLLIHHPSDPLLQCNPKNPTTAQEDPFPRTELGHRENADGGKVLVPTTVVPAAEAAPVSHSGARAGSPTEKPPRPGAENRLLQLLRDLRCSADRCRAWAPAGSSPGHVGREGCGGRTGCPSPASRSTPGGGMLGAPQRDNGALGGWASCCHAAPSPVASARELGDCP